MSDATSQPLEDRKRCPKCGGDMTQGFVLDLVDLGNFHVPNWFSGVPQRGGWQSIKVEQKKAIPIATFRCSACGFLESYAERQFDAN